MRTKLMFKNESKKQEEKEYARAKLAYGICFTKPINSLG